VKPLTLDVETDIYNNGNPFDSRNKLVCVAQKWMAGAPTAEKWETYHLNNLQYVIDSCDVIVGFNFKFDYHWLYNNGVRFGNKRIWDCQAAHYILTGQTHIFPSLNDVLAHYGLAPKLDIVKRDYWDNNVTTSEIPWDILKPYAIGDVDGTYEVFLRQWKEATEAQRALILLDGQDMHVLREMEYNGIPYNEEMCVQRSKEIDENITKIEGELKAIYSHVPINFASNDHLSAFLYGGCIEEVVKVHDGFYKTGLKAGQPRLKNTIVTHNLPALYKPVRGSELKKAGYYATNEPTLRQLKGNTKIINLILELARLEKLNGTYYRGIPELNKKMNWEHGVLHSNFNLTQTATGRLSSSKPNQQNFSSEILDIFESRYNA